MKFLTILSVAFILVYGLDAEAKCTPKSITGAWRWSSQDAVGTISINRTNSVWKTFKMEDGQLVLSKTKTKSVATKNCTVVFGDSDDDHEDGHQSLGFMSSLSTVGSVDFANTIMLKGIVADRVRPVLAH